MADSKRLAVLKSLTSLIEGTTGFNLAGKVWRGRQSIGDETKPPCVLLFELPPDDDIRFASELVGKFNWSIGIHGYTDALYDHVTDSAHDMLAAVKVQLGRIVDMDDPSYMLGGLVEGFEYDGGMTIYPRETTNVSMFVMRLNITIVENLGDPYEI